jgi:hypothetical protein
MIRKASESTPSKIPCTRLISDGYGKESRFYVSKSGRNLFHESASYWTEVALMITMIRLTGQGLFHDLDCKLSEFSSVSGSMTVVRYLTLPRPLTCTSFGFCKIASRPRCSPKPHKALTVNLLLARRALLET